MSGPTNDFLPVAIASGANVLSQAAYIASPILGSGNLPGVASAQFNNKALRQSSYMAAAIAQYLANISGNNVNDNGDAAYTALLATMAQVFPSRTTPFTPAWVGSTTNPTLGSLATNKGFQQRVADKLEFDVTYTKATTGTAPTDGSGTYLMTLPGALSMDSSKVGSIGAYPSSIIGPGAFPSRIGTGIMVYNPSTSPVSATIGVYAYSATQIQFVVDNNAIALASGSYAFSGIYTISFKASVPISGW